MTRVLCPVFSPELNAPQKLFDWPSPCLYAVVCWFFRVLIEVLVFLDVAMPKINQKAQKNQIQTNQIEKQNKKKIKIKK